MSIRIIHAGPLTTVQDAGRSGYLRSGIGPSGVMDRAAYTEANYLAGNVSGEAVLEFTLFGPTLCFEEPTIFALTGAEMNARLDGRAIGRGTVQEAAAGQTLVMGLSTDGCRGYLSVFGGITVPAVMGSRSTSLKCRIGGLEGRALKDGDLLPAGNTYNLTDLAKQSILQRRTEPHSYGKSATVRVIPGPQADCFTQDGLRTFLSSAWLVSPQSDRMGIRFDGPVIESAGSTDIVSDGIVFGSVQVPSDGKPIILMADRQTTGGYAKIATVVTEDLPLLAQRKPGDRVSFAGTTVEAAQKEIVRKAVADGSRKGFFHRLFSESDMF